MDITDNPPRRRVKRKIKSAELKLKVENARLRRKIKELEQKFKVGWLSPDEVWCDIKYASDYTRRSIQRLRNMKSQGIGPNVHSESGAVLYKVAELRLFNESGWGLKDVLADRQKISAIK